MFCKNVMFTFLWNFPESVVREIAWTLIQVIGQVEIASSELQLFLKLFLKTKNMVR